MLECVQERAVDLVEGLGGDLITSSTACKEAVAGWAQPLLPGNQQQHETTQPQAAPGES